MAKTNVDLTTTLGSVTLPNPVMTASGTAGYGNELSEYMDLQEIGAVVVKSLHAEKWEGNLPPRLHPTPSGMLNSVGLQGPGVKAWIDEKLPSLKDSNARIVASIWGSTVKEFTEAALLLRDAPPEVVAIEINASCPNLEDRRKLFSHSIQAITEVVEAANVVKKPLWAKLSPNTPELPDIAEAAHKAGAEAVVIANTVLGMAIDVESRKPVLGAKRGGLSGPAIRPIAVRAVFDTHEAHPGLPIIGVGGINSAEDALEFILAGATGLQIGTATFKDPRICKKVIAGLSRWCESHAVNRISDLIGGAHD
ncbi:MAG: dihydroorotate dehydrogenase [Acidimicrobiales bacterium]|nr:dihydroorotate dehydrogenase [Acidimicrobiales bacterium]